MSISSPPPCTSPPPCPPAIPPRDSHKRKSGSCDDFAHLRLFYNLPALPDYPPSPISDSRAAASSLLVPMDALDADDESSPSRNDKRLCTKAVHSAAMELIISSTSSSTYSGSSSPSSALSPLSDVHSASFFPDTLSPPRSSSSSFDSLKPLSTPSSLSSPFSTAPPPPYRNALSTLISVHLPPVLTDIVMTYYAAILPGRQQYAGHAYLDNNAYFRFSNEYRLSAPHSLSLCPPLRLDNRSFSWSGWMNRVSTADNQFLFSFSNPHLHIPPLLSNLHVGYRHYQIHSRHVDCFTFGFWCNDLDAKNAADVTAVDEWEHWAGTFEYPVSSPLPSFASSALFSILPPSMAFPSLTSPSLGHRSLYRNGRLVCADDCPAFIGKHCELAVGNRLVSSAAREGLKGGIADLRIWSRVVSEEEVLRLYEGEERGVRKDGLEVWYRFDESEEGLGVEGAAGEEERGRLLLDHSGHGRHASLIMGAEIRQMKHSGMQEYPKLPAWEGQPH